MNIFVPKEKFPETRCALTPKVAAKFVKLGASISCERGLGLPSGFPDADYEKSGAHLVSSASDGFHLADMVLRVGKPDFSEIPSLKPSTIYISFLDPFQSKSTLVEMSKSKIFGIAMEMIPRTTRAQKMDALSSQANLAGYEAVIVAAHRLHRIFPLMMTAAGTISPARVFVIGAGVAGLQAIATAKRLGAKVSAFDTRPVVEDQVKSLGATFIKVDLGETGQTQGGYAKELSAEQLALQREVMKKTCIDSDVVITTAQVFGKKAPILVTHDMVAAMRPGSVVVDLAVESGGNVEGVKLNEEVEFNGVHIIGLANLAGRAAQNASETYANNVYALVEEFWDKDEKRFRLLFDDDILKSALVAKIST